MTTNWKVMQNGQVYLGNAVNNTQTDQESVIDAGNEYVSNGGNLTLVGNGHDSATTIDLKGSNTTDVISLYGGGNWLDNAGLLNNAAVTFAAYDSGGASDYVDLTNTHGTTSITSLAADADITLNGDATNQIVATGGGASIAVGFLNDYAVGYGFSTGITIGGQGNSITGGDENFTIATNALGGSGSVSLGDGNNFVTLAAPTSGPANSVTVGGGNNTITVFGSGSTVNIRGIDGLNAPAYAPDPHKPAVPASPTDLVTISGANDVVNATYENVVVNGALVTGNATITLGSGNNSVVLGGTGGNHVTVGNGGNLINVAGNTNVIRVGNGANGVTLSGNNNSVTVVDPTGSGLDIVQLGAGTGDSVAFDHAGGSVTGTGTGTTTVTQSAGYNIVKVNLGAGTGIISLAHGADTVVANGNNSVITLGWGANKITANGDNDRITAAGGANTVIANGFHDTITLGSGANNVTANGNNDTFSFGNGKNVVSALGNGDVGTFGSGSNILTATGTGDNFTFNAISTSVNTVSYGAGSTLTDKGGVLNFTSSGAGDTLNLTSTDASSIITATGNSETFNLYGGAGGHFVLGGAAIGDAFTFNPTSGNYAGNVFISNFALGDTVKLTGLTDAGGYHFGLATAAADFHHVVLDLASNNSGGGQTLALQGGGSITFVATTGFKASEFIF